MAVTGTKPINFDIKAKADIVLATMYVPTLDPNGATAALQNMKTTYQDVVDLAIENSPVQALTANTTVNLNNAMTASEIQALIDAQPKNLNGYSLTYQFADGTYTLDSTISINRYYAGVVSLSGNIGESGLHSNQAVILNSSASTIISITNNTATIGVKNIKVDGSGSNSIYGIYLLDNPGAVDCNGNWIVLGTGTSRCFSAARCAAVSIYNNYVTDGDRGIETGTTTQCQSNNNVTLTTNQQYGLLCSASIIFKIGTQPTGDTSNETKFNGGQIY
jgi:hypothetical protein